MSLPEDFSRKQLAHVTTPGRRNTNKSEDEDNYNPDSKQYSNTWDLERHSGQDDQGRASALATDVTVRDKTVEGFSGMLVRTPG